MIEVSAFTKKAADRSMFRRSWLWTRGTPARKQASVRCAFGIALVAMMVIGIGSHAYAVVVFDDFSDGTDGSVSTPNNPNTDSPPNVTGPVWSRLDGYANLFGPSGQTWDASSGAYRMTALNNGYIGYGLVGSYVPTSFADVKVSADFISFGGPSINPAFGILARTNGQNGFFTGAQALTGYGLIYEPFSGPAGEINLERFDNDGSAFHDISPEGSHALTLDPSKDYTFTLTIIGSVLRGQVFEIGGGMVFDFSKIDTTYTSGYSGLMSLSQGAYPTVDFTIDNFRTEDVAAGVLGDFNNNSVVDAADYAVWRKNNGTGNALPNDNGLGTPIGQSHYNLWRAHFGQPPGSGSELGNGGSVPEPTGVALAVLGFASSYLARSRSRRR